MRLPPIPLQPATEEMHEHYSTVAANEMRAGLAQIVSIAGVRAA